MKTLVEYINEAIVNEGKETFVKFKLFNDDASKKLVDDMNVIAQKADVYYERIDDNSFKIKTKEGKNIDSIVTAIDNLINNLDDEKKEEYSEKIEKLESSIEKLKNAVQEETSEEDESDKKKEEE